MTKWKDSFYEALRPLSWGYNAGDDGTLITLTLDQADSLLRRLPTFAGIEADDLEELLRGKGVSSREIASVRKLWELGRAASYGEGLSGEDAAAVNELGKVVVRTLEIAAGLQPTMEPSA